MSTRQTTLERAFTLAKSGEYAGVSEIRAQLRAEGYALQQMEGPSLMKQLRDLCLAARQGKDLGLPSDGVAGAGVASEE